MSAGPAFTSSVAGLFALAAAGVSMKRALLRSLRSLIVHCIPLLAAFVFGTAFAQVPIPMQEQIRLFNSLPPSQQQSLIRELQRQLPPAQREAILGMLQGRAEASSPADPAAEAALADAMAAQNEVQGGQGLREEPRLKPRDTLVLQFERSTNVADGVVLTPDQIKARDEFQERLAKGNPYSLDGSGLLYLPGVPTIALAGLNVDEATVRVGAEPALKPFNVVLTFLPLEPVGTAALKPFGYDLFGRPRGAFAPPSDLPVPVDYVLGPGDTVNVQLFGSQNAEYFLSVSREGSINFPEIGPVSVSGLTFAQMRDTINERVSQQLIGVRASVTLGELRSIRVFVLGEVQRPGSHSVSGLATITNALFASGGVKTIGSLRNVMLRRDGSTVSSLDLYDLLLRGDTRGDVRLMPGDAIFVPPIGESVSVDGEVRRPAVYELRGERTVADLIALAGGLNANASRRDVKLERVVANRGTTVQDLDLDAAGSRAVVRDGDVLRVPANLDQLEGSVRLAGNVFRPGLYQWREGMRLRDLLPSPDLLKPFSDLGYVLVRRESAPNVDLHVLSADLRSVWAGEASQYNIALQPRDIVHVFNIETGRGEVLAPLIEQLGAQAAPNAPLPIVRVGGQVRAPGEYPIEPGMRVSDLLRAGGGLSDAAYATDAELTRYEVVNGEYRETELLTVNLAGLVRGNSADDLVVSPYDYLNVKEVSRWRGEEAVTIRGEVFFPGVYPIRRGETLSSVLARAGGLTELAFPEGSVFTREDLRQREREQLEVLARRVERDLAAISVSDPNASNTVTAGQSLITQLRSAVATGRLVIRLHDIVRGVKDADIVLKNGDTLLVPEQRQEVTVLGEVQYATSHMFDRTLNRENYIDKSGGLTQRADRKRIYIVRAGGDVVVQSGTRWFSRGGGSDVRAGDTIVVPLDVDQPLARWSAITQIIYNLAIAAAAVNSF